MQQHGAADADRGAVDGGEFYVQVVVSAARQFRGLGRDDLFLAVHEQFPTATAAFADLLLPAATWGEKDGTVTNSERRISRVRAASRKSSDMTSLAATASSELASATSRRSSARAQAGWRAMI